MEENKQIVKIVKKGNELDVQFEGNINDALNMITIGVRQVAVMGFEQGIDPDIIFAHIDKATGLGVKEAVKSIKKNAVKPIEDDDIKQKINEVLDALLDAIDKKIEEVAGETVND